MDAPPEREDCAPFIDIAARLRAAGLNAPRIIAKDTERGFLLLEHGGELRVAVFATQELQAVAEENADHVARDLLPLIEWAERQYKS